jgi:phosphate-selective porin OprO and OprP
VKANWNAYRITASRLVVVGLSSSLLSVTGAPAAADPAPQAQTAAPAQTTLAPGPSPAPTPAALAAPSPAPAATDFFFPDLPAKALVHDGEHFWIKPIIAVVGDYTWFAQDDASLGQVGKQEDTPELRAGRFGVTVRSKDRLKLEFYATVDYQERRTREDAHFQLYDLQLRIPLGPVKLQIGKQKIPFAYELVGLSVLLPQQERILLPFYPSRNIGAQFSGQLARGRMTWAAGWFNDWLETDVDRKDNASDYVGRVSGLAWVSPDNRDFLHLGLGLMHHGPDSGETRFAGRPESNVADKFTDTGDFPANHANQLSLEGLISRGPFSVLAERIEARVDAPESGDPTFWGAYVAASWMLTGESRPYNRVGGWAGGITPRRRLGAVELVAKYSRIDLTDGLVDGGLLSKWHFGVNWWASAQWKLGLSYGLADLDKGGVRGKTDMVLFRFQWLY